jgi:cytosine deaminase
VHDATESTSLILRGARVLRESGAQLERCDIGIGRNGLISSIGASLPSGPGIEVAELAGRLIVPGLFDMHQHLDKTRTRELVTNSDNTLAGAVRAYDSYARASSPQEIMQRAETTILACINRGTIAIRTHVNIGPDHGLRGIEALVALRERFSDRLTLQVVVLVPAAWWNSARQWIDSAVAIGADAVGGAPAHADDPKAFLALLFDAAERHGVAVDLHLDEHLDSAHHRFHEVIALTQARGMQGRVVAGHCSALGAMTEADAQPIIEGFARAKIGVVTLPTANLYLLGREAAALTPRGLTRAKALSRAGVAVAIASDNIQDPFVPTGTGDLIELARWTMLVGHFDAGDFLTVFRMISETPARLSGLANRGIRVGARADLLITDAADIADLIASGPLERTVLSGGKIVAGTLPTSLTR